MPPFLRASSLQPPASSLRRGLTLIELLVTVVIMVTLLAAVLPAVSPNNDARKLREAARQLNSLIAQAQAQAARDGRFVGIGFGDAWTDADNDGERDPDETSGMALEAYIIAEPPPFSGFSEDSSVIFGPPPSSAPPVGQDKPPLLSVRFGHGVGGEGIDTDNPVDVIPPGTLRGAFVDPEIDVTMPPYDNVVGTGDVIQVGQERFEILTNDCDDVDDTDSETDVEMINGVEYLSSQKELVVRWLTWNYRDLDLMPQGGRRYRINRQPASANRPSGSPSRTSAPTLQFPRGVGIDMDPTEGNFTAAVMFSPTGQLECEYRDGNRNDDRDPVFILLGRVENANPLQLRPSPNDPNVELERYDFRDPMTDDELAERREQVNLLNADSQWIAIAPSGRVVSAENYVFDPRELLANPLANPPDPTLFIDTLTGDDEDQLDDQRDRWREEAQTYARRFENASSR